jgi:phage tail protein X
MKAHTSWLVAAGILLLGALAALPFQQSGSSGGAGAAAGSNQLPWNGEPLTLRVAGDADHGLPATTDATTDVAHTPLAPIYRTDRDRSLEALPSMDSQYGGLLNRYGAEALAPAPARARSLDSLSVPATPQAAPTTEDLAAAEKRAALEPRVVRRPRRDTSAVDVQEPQPARTHRIVDGDTLESIAERYYGNAAYADRVFRANRDKLAAADLLPLGTELLLPPQPELDRSAAMQPLANSATAAEEPASETPRTPLAPIDL